MGTFDGYDIARSGIHAYSASMQTAAHNLANIGTKGYSKQVVNVTAQTRNISSIKVQGSGVFASDIERQHSDYYDTKYEASNSTYNKYSTSSYYLTELERYIYAADETEGGLTTSFDNLCKTLSATIADGGNMTRRQEILTYAETFTEFIQDSANNLKSLQAEANIEIKNAVEQVNALAEKIATVTGQINKLESYGNTANDLRDQRAVLLDELSDFCHIDVVEKPPADGVGGNQFLVYVNGGILVDTIQTNKLIYTETEIMKGQNDIKGLYNVTRENGTPFDQYSTALGGKLQALFEIRDGNNTEALKGTAESLMENSDGKLVLKINNASINDIRKLSIPQEKGEINIISSTYTYESFSVEPEDDGTFTYSFVLNANTTLEEARGLRSAVDRGATVSIGQDVDFKGIPYYMAQLNEFTRTYAQRFNDIHKEGFDASGKSGIDVFNATIPTTGENFTFADKSGEVPAAFDSMPAGSADGTYKGSYYYMTALNVCITKEVADDPTKLAFNQMANSGESESLNLQRLSALKDDSKMFLRGAPDAFLQAMTTDVAVDARKMITLETSQKNIRDAVDIRRQSISGTDEDEETQDLVTYQNLLFNQYKVLSVMNEVLDKLINGTAV
ncbi:flagellar hook-associated protein FlgK [Eubacterium xylanophilum]|uniref:flagellar hook-associated protein FlgK n=1 Tax=Eubacterium xylanophilum TaxID=39497 RepID=UPI00047EB139|nr:hypothetical protein [Eubacterium xylanophilum]